MFRKHLRHCWRWDDFSILTTIIQSLDSTDHCMQLIHQYKKKIYSKMKLKDIHEYCEQESKDLPEGYHKMVAIVEKKSFLRITLKEYMELKDFISQHCEMEPYGFLSPFAELGNGSLSSTDMKLIDIHKEENKDLPEGYVETQISPSFDSYINKQQCMCVCMATAHWSAFTVACQMSMSARIVFN